MHFARGHILILLFNLVYILGFTAYYVSIKNFEFLWYVSILVFFFVLIATTLHRSRFSLMILWGLSLWGLMHMAGGGITIGGDVLYAFVLIPFFDGGGDFTILKYDQFVHAFGFGVSTLLVYHLLLPYLNEKVNWKIIYPILVVAGAGMGVLNEIVEFVAVLVVPDNGVGGYENTLLDLVFNTVGAVIAVIYIHYNRLKNIRQ